MYDTININMYRYVIPGTRMILLLLQLVVEDSLTHVRCFFTRGTHYGILLLLCTQPNPTQPKQYRRNIKYRRNKQVLHTKNNRQQAIQPAKKTSLFTVFYDTHAAHEFSSPSSLPPVPQCYTRWYFNGAGVSTAAAAAVATGGKSSPSFYATTPPFTILSSRTFKKVPHTWKYVRVGVRRYFILHSSEHSAWGSSL